MSPFLTVFGRLKPGFSLAQANAEMRVIHRQYAFAHPTMLDAKPKTPVEVTAMKDDMVADVSSMLWMLFGAVGFVLLVACANVASLLLVRATSRSREMAVRAALGAARIRLVGQLLAESVLWSLSGGVLGVLLAAWSLRAIPLITAFDLPRAGEIHLDWLVIGFAAALSLATGALFGLAPSLAASRPDLIRTLRAGGESANQGVPRGILSSLNVRGLLLVGQVALSIVLLIGAMLLIKSVWRLRGVDVGFNPAHLLTMQVSLPRCAMTRPKKERRSFGNSSGSLDRRRRSQRRDGYIPSHDRLFGNPVQDAGKPPLKLMNA